MIEWKLPKEKLKNYPHFDAPISAEAATKLSANPDYVSKHAFLPLIGYTKSWKKFSKKGKKRELKSRDICYASRKDSYIYSYYRHILSSLYEESIKEKGISSSILAYRKILSNEGKTGKCNIDFAKDAFDAIKTLGDCQVICLDIRSYFDSIDHDNIKSLWKLLLKKESLPKDHFKVFRAITQYSVVDRKEFFSEIGLYGPKKTTHSGAVINGYLAPKSMLSTKICPSSKMRKVFEILKGDKKRNNKPPFHVNYKKYGIPQGVPLSDLLANLNLIYFDEYSRKISDRLGGMYYRYSDDILFILPIDYYRSLSLLIDIDEKIKESGRMLEISLKKSSIIHFYRKGNSQEFTVLYGDKGKNGLEYLGFRYNGKKIFIRDGTLSNVYRKATYALKRECLAYARRYPDKHAPELSDIFDFHAFYQKFLTIEDYKQKSSDKRNWNFFTYVKKSASIMQENKKDILSQLDRFHYYVADNLLEYMKDAVKIRSKIRKTKKYFIHPKPVAKSKKTSPLTSPTPA